MSTVLPRSLAPLPDEALPGYLLRLAHRLDMSPAQLAAATGLSATATIPAAYLLALPPAVAERFSHAARLSLAEAHTLTLSGLASRYPPVDLRYCGRQRLARGLLIKENWVLSRATRYCPDCLAGDASTIQDRHGGAFTRAWRLPVIFACLTHQRLLHHTCPACGALVHHRDTSSYLLPLPAHAGLDPTACRAPLSGNAPGWRSSPCAYRLDTPQPRRPSNRHRREQVLWLQRHLADRLDPDRDVTVISVGQPTTADRTFVDLRILACLITASWPATRHLVTNPTDRTLINAHVRDIRHAIDTVRADGRAVRELACYDRPPLPADTCAALLALADSLTSSMAPDALTQVLRQMIAMVPSARPWTRQFLTGDGFCSPGLHTVLGREVGSKHVIARTGPPPRPPQPPPRPVGFALRHVPAHALPAWRQQDFAAFADVTAHLLGRAVSARLAQLAIGGPAVDAGVLLGLPRTAVHYAITTVTGQLGHARQRAFDRAIDNLADRLPALGLIDYGRRRNALRTWDITVDQWQDLTDGLPEQPIHGHVRTHTHWGDGKRILASVWIWTQLTAGEHIYAPQIRPDPDSPRPGGLHAHYVHTRWPFIRDATGHYAALRQRLDTLASQLADEIDGRNPNDGERTEK